MTQINQNGGESSAEISPQRTRKIIVTSKRFFDAGESDRFTTGWGTQPLTADQIIERNQRALVARSREQATNNDYAKKFLRLCVNNIVGPTGVILQAKSKNRKGVLDTASNEAIELAFGLWGQRKNCDIQGKKSWRGIQAACINSAASDGEFFVRMIWGSDAGPWGFSLQVIDPQRCPIDFKEEGLAGGAFIRQGIEFNRYGRPVAYYFDSQSGSADYYRCSGQSFTRVPADEILHGFIEDMTGQRRGVPWMSSCLTRLRHLNRMEDAALINARASANKSGFVTFAEGTGPSVDDSDEFYVKTEPGEMTVLPEGAAVETLDMQYPNGEFAVFVKQMLRGAASGMNVNYNTLANDLEGVNFSSIRQGTLDEREHWKEVQEWFIENLHEPVFEAWLKRALLSGKIKAKGKPLPAGQIDRFSMVAWQPRRWAWIDPSADATAAEKSKNNMLTSPGRIIREGGNDPDAVWKESASDVRRMIDAYMEQGIDEETAKKLVMQSMGMDKQLLAGTPNGEETNTGTGGTKTGKE